MGEIFSSVAPAHAHHKTQSTPFFTTEFDAIRLGQNKKRGKVKGINSAPKWPFGNSPLCERENPKTVELSMFERSNDRMDERRIPPLFHLRNIIQRNTYLP